ncbi:MAG TPA: nitrite reductase small subunit NirD [Puia sp.]|jgi:nitrite reductase (NADH) small subunit|nr:nitrite reductase small subunit NirD [Puia sp.]
MQTLTQTDTKEPIQNLKWQLACHIDDIPKDGGACVLMDGEQIAIFRFDRRDEWFATQNRCPHKQQMALARGMTGSTGETCEPKVACPFHKKTFSLLTGECLSGDDYRIRTYPVKVKGDKVYVGISSQ